MTFLSVELDNRMETTSERNFWVKRSASVSAIGLPFAIITVGFTGQLHRKLWGEFFLFVFGQIPYFAGQRVLVKTGNVPAELVNLDREFMQSELEQQINGKLSSYLFRSYTNSKSDIYLENLQLDREGTTEDIIGLWMRGLFHDELRRVRETTCSDDLRKFLDRVVELPTFSSSTLQRADQ